MISSLNIWRAATLLINQHGENAVLAALERHANMLVDGDQVGAARWSEIRQAIKELQAQPSGQRIDR